MTYNIKTKIITLSVFLLFFLTGFTYAVEFDEIGEVDVHGGVSFGYMLSDDNNLYADTSRGTFQFTDMFINFSTDLADRIHAAIQLYSYDLGTMNNYNVFLDRAFLTYDYKEWLNFSGGLIKIPHGLYNESRDSDFLRTNILLPQSIYQDSWRDVIASNQAISVFGEHSTEQAGSIIYNLQFGAPNINEDTGVSRFLADLLPPMLTIETKKIDIGRDTYMGSLFWNTPIDGLKIGNTGYKTNIEMNADVIVDSSFLSALPTEMTTSIMSQLLIAYPDVFNNAGDSIPVLDFFTGMGILFNVNPIDLDINARNHVLSMEYIRNDFTFAAEYAQQKIEMSFNKLEAPMDILMSSSGSTADTIFTQRTEGYYGSIAYRVSDSFELGVYYSEYYPNKKDKNGKGNDVFTGFPKYAQSQRHRAWQKDTCMTIRYSFEDNVAVKLEGHIMDGTAQLNRVDNPDGFDKDWFLFAAKVSYIF